MNKNAGTERGGRVGIGDDVATSAAQQAAVARRENPWKDAGAHTRSGCGHQHRRQRRRQRRAEDDGSEAHFGRRPGHEGEATKGVLE